MNINFKKIPLVNECVFNLSELDNYTKNIGINNLYLIRLYLLLRLNKDISNKEFYKIIMKLVDIDLDNNDYLKYLEFRDNKKYKIIKVETDLILRNINSTGSGYNFRWQCSDSQLYMYLLLPSDLNIDISSMLNSKDVIEIIRNPNIHYIGFNKKNVVLRNLTFPYEYYYKISDIIEEERVKDFGIIDDFLNGKLDNIDEKTFDFLCDTIKNKMKNNEKFIYELRCIIDSQNSQMVSKCNQDVINFCKRELESDTLGEFKNPLDEYFHDEKDKFEYVKKYRQIKKLN